MHIEVLVCTHNRVALLEKMLRSLNDTRKPDNCNLSITVVLNACEDNTQTMLEQYHKNEQDNCLVPLRWFVVKKPGKSNALNYAIPRLQGDLICLIDDDHRISSQYFTTLVEAYSLYKEDAIFFGKILPDWTGDEPKWAHETGKYAIYPLPVPHYDKGDEIFEFDNNVAIPGGGNLALKREVFNRVGLFNTDLGPQGHNLGGGEDGDYVLRAIKGGEKLRYLPDMVQYHYVDLKRFHLFYMLLKSYQRSCSVISIHNKNITRLPLYLWRKLFTYTFNVIFSLSISRSRFFLIRCAAVLGEINGFRKVIKANNNKEYN